MPVITLLTDFGLTDEYVGLMKGVILSINPEATVVDLSHGIDAQDVAQAGYLLKSSHGYFPLETIHVAVVDPGVGSERSILALRLHDQIFLAPDNGLLQPLLLHNQPQALLSVTNRRYFGRRISHTFHGRDIFAPVAAHLSLGLSIQQLGDHRPVRQLTPFPIPHPEPEPDGGWRGRVITIDRFGNLVTDILLDQSQTMKQNHNSTIAEIEVDSLKIIGLSRTYSDVPLGQPLALTGSRGYLEIAMNGGNAARHYTIAKGAKVRMGYR